jgi:hypothetical protein
MLRFLLVESAIGPLHGTGRVNCTWTSSLQRFHHAHVEAHSIKSCSTRKTRTSRTKRDNLILAGKRPIIPENNHRGWVDGSKSGSALLRQAGRCSAFHPCCQFGYVSGRTIPHQRPSDQLCGADLQSQANHG